MAIKFTTSHPPKVGTAVGLIPGTAYAFEDENAEAFFVAAGWAETTADDPIATIPASVVSIDPNTKFGGGANKGHRVLAGS